PSGRMRPDDKHTRQTDRRDLADELLDLGKGIFVGGEEDEIPRTDARGGHTSTRGLAPQVGKLPLDRSHVDADRLILGEPFELAGIAHRRTQLRPSRLISAAASAGPQLPAS